MKALADLWTAGPWPKAVRTRSSMLLRCLGLALATLLLTTPVSALEDGDEEDHEERVELLLRIAEAHFERAWLLAEERGVEAAIEELRKIEQLPLPDDEEAAEQRFRVHHTMIELYLEAERFTEAERLARQALERFSDRGPRLLGQLHLVLGYSLQGLDRAAEALEAFDRSIALGHQALREGDD